MSACSDASPIIHLSRVDRLSLLPELFGRVLISTAVFEEVVGAGLERFGCAELRAATWAELADVAPTDLARSNAIRSLGAGEAAAILVALDRGCDFVLLDDARARVVARDMGLQVRGTLGILLEAKRRGLVVAVAPLVLELRRSGMWMSKTLMQAVLHKSGERIGNDA